jgi:[ribosomal protein S18]-alanine N-acetyltransferase
VSEPLLIRRVLHDDLPRIAQLEADAFGDSWSIDLLASEIEQPSALLLQASRGESPACGYTAFRHVWGEAELLRLAVLPAERRRGVGRALVEHGLEQLRQVGVRTCHLEVRLDNEPAIALYRSLGFRPAGRRRGYYRDGSDALVLSREL